MAGERTIEGWETRLRAHGISRFFGAGFLIVWLCGWAAGEGFALWFLVNGAQALLTGTPPGPGRAPLPIGPALGLGAFLLVWLFLWTLGGLAAWGELLRLLWGEDRILARASGVLLLRTRGPFRTRRELRRDEIRGVLLTPRQGSLTVQTTRASVELSRLGTQAEREEAASVLRSELGLGDPSDESEETLLPRGWEEAITPEGERAVVPEPATRAAQARVAWVVAAGVGTVAFFITRGSIGEPALIPFGALATAAALGLAGGALWLSWGRLEWRLGSGRVTLRRRFGSNVRDLFEAARLELSVSRDSDGDVWYVLEALTGGAAPGRRRVASSVHDPTIPRRLGRWIARTAGIPLEDHGKLETPEVEIARLRSQLESSGPLGRWAARALRSAVEGKGKGT